MVTGFTQLDLEENSRKGIQRTINDYENYKKWFKFPDGIKGKLMYRYKSTEKLKNIILIQVLLDYEWGNKLRYVRIYFDTPTFDRITKDKAAKFVDMLSAVGGTMGLLTGFSIISGVEILYFAWKFIFSIGQKMK